MSAKAVQDCGSAKALHKRRASVQGCAWLRSPLLGRASAPPIAARCARLRKAVQGCATLFKAVQGCAKLCKAAHICSMRLSAHCSLAGSARSVRGACEACAMVLKAWWAPFRAKLFSPPRPNGAKETSRPPNPHGVTHFFCLLLQNCTRAQSTYSQRTVNAQSTLQSTLHLP